MKLSEDSVNFSKEHIQKYYDSDFFPTNTCFEYLWQCWTQVKDYLISTDIDDFDYTIPLSFAAPKSISDFRIVHQLELMNTLIYTALAYMVAPDIETARVQKTEKIACSYRINITPSGDFFDSTNGYEDFTTKSKELSSKYEYILATDITDFYNQIYVHRVQNAIENANPRQFKLSKHIEDFLLKINNNSSLRLF